MNARLEKTLARVRQRIADREFYEAHQALRTVAARHIKARQYDEAVELLFRGARELLAAGEGGSGGDLARYMVDTFKVAKTPVDGESRAKVVELFKLFEAGEPRRKEYVQDVVQWSGTDAELFHIFGSAYASEDAPYEAERFLLLGTKDSAGVLARMLFEWFTEDPDDRNAPFYISRAVLGYLGVGNIRDARRSLEVYIGLLTAAGRVRADKVGEVAVFDGAPLLNYLQLLVRVCQCRSADLFKRLNQRYRVALRDTGALDDAVGRIGERFCGIPVRGQANVMDLVGSLFAKPAQPDVE